MAKSAQAYKAVQDYKAKTNFGVFKEKGPGMEYINAMKEANRIEREEVKPSNLIVGVFGIKDEKNNDILINWKIDGWRKHKDWESEKPEPPSKYGKSLFESMFKGWN